MWITYRYNTSAHFGEWTTREVPDYLKGHETSKKYGIKEGIKDWLETSVNSIPAFSEHYRGLDIKIIKNPPIEIVNERIMFSRGQAKFFESEKKRYLKMKQRIMEKKK